MATSSFDNHVSALSDDARRAEAVRARQQRSDRSLAAALSGTFAGTLVELAETQAPATFRTRSSDAIRGYVTGLGPDIVLVQPPGAAQRVVIRRLAIEAIIEHGPGHDRSVEAIDEGPELATILDDLSADHERIGLTLATGNKMMGAIVSVGVDQVVLRLDGEADTGTIPLFAIDQVVLTV